MKNKTAFTLTEILITLIVLSVGIVGLLQAYKQLISALDATRNYQDSVCLLKNKMVDIELQGVGESKVNMTGNFTDEYSKFSWEIKKVAEVENVLAEVRVSVFNNKDDKKRNFNVLTYVQKTE